MKTNKETKLTLHARPISPTAVVECTVLMTPPPPPRKKEVAVLKKKSDVMDSDTLSDEAAEELLLQMIEIGICIQNIMSKLLVRRTLFKY